MFVTDERHCIRMLLPIFVPVLPCQPVKVTQSLSFYKQVLVCCDAHDAIHIPSVAWCWDVPLRAVSWCVEFNKVARKLVFFFFLHPLLLSEDKSHCLWISTLLKRTKSQFGTPPCSNTLLRCNHIESFYFSTLCNMTPMLDCQCDGTNFPPLKY